MRTTAHIDESSIPRHPGANLGLSVEQAQSLLDWLLDQLGANVYIPRRLNRLLALAAPEPQPSVLPSPLCSVPAAHPAGDPQARHTSCAHC